MSNSQTILGESFENTKLLIIFAILAIVNLIGFSIKDFNFKICYWLSIALILITIINLNMSKSVQIVAPGSARLPGHTTGVKNGSF